MRIIKILIIPFLLTSCSVLDLNNIAPGYKDAYSSMKTLLFEDKQNKDLTEDLISNIPYASAIVSIGKGKDALLILESVSKEEYTWVSADGIYIVTKNGRIIKTSGLENNLIDFIEPNLNFRDVTDKSASYLRYVSFDNPELFNLKVSVILEYKGAQQLELFSSSKDLYLYTEAISNEYLGWKRENKYWVDDNSFVYKSIQHISPKLPEFYFEITKKPAK